MDRQTGRHIRQRRAPTLAAGAMQSDGVWGILASGGQAAPARAITDSLFVGREREMQLISATIDQVVAGDGASLLVTGEAGVGKSRLLQNVFATQDHPAHWVMCTSHASAPAFWPISQLLRSIRLRVGAETYREAAGGQSALLFDPLETPGKIGEVLGGNIDRMHLHDRVISLLRRLAQPEALLLVIEDVQWADPSTIELVSIVTRAISDHPIGVFLTVRSGDPDHPMTSQLEDLGQTLSTVRLRRFNRRVTSDFIDAVTGDAADEALLNGAFDATGGNALFLREYLAASDRSLRLNTQGVAQLISRRVDKVDAADRDVVIAAAVAGDMVDVSLLAQVTGYDLDAVGASLERLAKADLIVYRDRGHVAFAHGVVRDAIYRNLAGPRRRELHQAVAEALDNQSTDDPGLIAAESARHWLLSESPHSDAIALSRIRTSAQMADATYAREEAARRYQEAIDIVDSNPESYPADVVIELLLGLGRAHAASTRPEEARSVLRRAAAVATDAGEYESLAHVALAFPPGLEGVAIAPEANLEQVELRHRALEHLPTRSVTLRAELLGALATAQYWTSHLRGEPQQFEASLVEQVRLTDQALDLATADQDDATLARCLLHRLYAVWSPDHRHERSARLGQLEQLATELGDLELLAATIGWRILESMEHGRHHEAKSRLDAYAELAEQMEHPLFRRNAVQLDACLNVLRGNLPQGVADAMASLEDAVRVIGEEHALAELAMLLSMERFFHGDYGSLIEPARHVIASNPRTTLNWQCGLAFMLADSGEHDEARPLFENLVGPDGPRLPRDINWMTCTQLLALTAAILGDHDRIPGLYDALLPFESLDAVHGWGYASYGPVGWSLGELALAAGDGERAVEHFEQVLRTREPGPYRAVAELSLIRARKELGRGGVNDLYNLQRLTAQLRTWGCPRHAAAADTLSKSFGQSAGSWSRLVRTDDVWQLESERFDTAEFGHDRGMSYLVQLLRQPGEPILALTLVSGGVNGSSSDSSYGAGGLGTLIDKTAKRAYQVRIEQLELSRARSARRGDEVRAEACAQEIAALTAELARTTGLGGRPRMAREESERARSSVTKAIRRTIGRIEPTAPDFANHLYDTVVTGRSCCYGPGPTTVNWLIDAS